MNFADMLISLIVGLAVPLAILDGLRGLVRVELPRQEAGFQLEARTGPWLLALIAGPGLLAEAMIDGARSGSLRGGNLLAGVLIVLLWATIHGFVVLTMIRQIGGLPQ